ncbi:MAG: hypothetical protein AAB289_04100 [Chloroflexota bacterium]
MAKPRQIRGVQEPAPAEVEALRDVARIRARQLQLEVELGQAVSELRALGVSWHRIGVSAGLTGEALRKRWS